MYCFDTNIIIDIFHGDRELAYRLKEINDEDLEIYLTPITLCELYKGAYLINEREEIKQIDEFISSFVVLDFDINSCKKFGEIYSELKKKGKMTEERDLMIASIVKANNLILITRNKKHFENTGVKLVVW